MHAALEESRNFPTAVNQFQPMSIKNAKSSDPNSRRRLERGQGNACPQAWWLENIAGSRRYGFKSPQGNQNLVLLFHGMCPAHYAKGGEGPVFHSGITISLALCTYLTILFHDTSTQLQYSLAEHTQQATMGSVEEQAMHKCQNCSYIAMYIPSKHVK